MSQSFFIKPKRKKYPYVIVCSLVLLALAWFFRPSPTAQTTSSAPKVYKPISYDVSEWQKHEQMAVDFDMAKGLLGRSAVQTQALDFYGNQADKYSFASAYEPDFYVIESKEVFELAWYFASAKDDDQTKQLSQKYAQKAYLVATALYGDDGRILLQNMLDEEPTTFEDDQLLLARCRDYLCQFVIKK